MTKIDQQHPLCEFVDYKAADHQMWRYNNDKM